MANLSEMYRSIGMYLELHGDKEVTSISTCCGHNAKNQYILNLHDIYIGPIGKNPFCGEDHIAILNDGPMTPIAMAEQSVGRALEFAKKDAMKRQAFLSKEECEGVDKDMSALQQALDILKKGSGYE